MEARVGIEPTIEDLQSAYLIGANVDFQRLTKRKKAHKGINKLFFGHFWALDCFHD